MNNELIKQKSWWKRYRKWLIPSVSLFVILLIITYSSGFGGVLTDYSKAYAESDLYEKAIEEVKQNERVKDLLGTVEPINNMTILNGYVTYSDDNNSVDTTIKISCTNGKAMLDISANRIDNIWNYNKINIRIKNPPENKETIEIIKSTE